ncbi:MAG: hypothetical protein O2894_10755 [Planctomycetota bacterium]|nr:hypothetical protein [Planctomycetota bacterium]
MPSQVPASSERPGLDSARRRGWTSWFLHEWSLLLLACVLAVIIWEITSTRVIREQRIEGVRVELQVAQADRERSVALLDTADAAVTIELTCSERERLAVLAALTETGGGTPALRLRVNGDVLEGTARAISASKDNWLWPVSNAEDIKMRAALPRGTIYRIEGMHQVNIARPATIPSTDELAKRGFRLGVADPTNRPPVDIALSRAYLEFLAPRALLGSGSGGLSVAPDAIDLRPLLVDDAPPLSAPLRFQLSFHGWRQAGDVADATQRERARQFRSQLEIEPVHATLTLERVAAVQLKNRIEALLHSDFEWMVETDVAELQRGGAPFTFTGSLQGPAAVLREIVDAPADWSWAIWISEPTTGWPRPSMGPEAADGEWTKGVPARIVWVPRRDEWRDRGVRFVPQAGSGQDNFYVKIRARARKP